MQTEPSTPSPRLGALVGIVAALPAEGRCLVNIRVSVGTSYAIGAHVLLIISGIGSIAARAASESLVAAGAGALVSWGVAAGLNSAQPGELVLADRVIALPTGDQSGRAGLRALWATASWTDRLAARLPTPILRGPIAGADRVLSSPQEKRAAGSSGALAADMETAAVAGVAQGAGIPWIAIRAISDGADHTLPSSVIHAINSAGEIRLSRLAAGLARHPMEVAELPRIARGFNAALRTLRSVSAAVGPTLLAPNCLDVSTSQSPGPSPAAEFDR
jgi:adenosylhomocysteine nucleosidase